MSTGIVMNDIEEEYDLELLPRWEWGRTFENLSDLEQRVVAARYHAYGWGAWQWENARYLSGGPGGYIVLECGGSA